MDDLYSFARTVTGRRHIDVKKPCQDHSAVYEDHYMSIAVVSDGHGGDEFTRSEFGAQLACDSTIAAMREFAENIDAADLRDEDDRRAAVLQLCKNIMLRWNLGVTNDFMAYPYDLPEDGDLTHLYGCTLLAVLFTEKYFLAIRNGDGQCVTLNINDKQRAEFGTPIPWNEKCSGNITTSLCGKNAIEDFRYSYSEELPVAAFIGTDGVDASYSSLNRLYNLYLAICKDTISDGADVAEFNLAQFMTTEFVEWGSGDDVSICAIVNERRLKDMAKQLPDGMERKSRSMER